jgi:hypothetical protein
MPNDAQLEAETVELGQNFPNPTNGNFKVNYSLPKQFDGAVLSIYDQFGRLKQNQKIEVGSNLDFNLQIDSWSNGTYYYSIEYFGTKLASKKLVLIK